MAFPMLIYTTQRGTKIYTQPGSKSTMDFIVRYRETGKRIRTPAHIHIITDLYIKRENDLLLTNTLVDHILQTIIPNLNMSNSYPPKLQIFTSQHISSFLNLNKYGEYDIEFLLVIIELLLLQEKTNYPNGKLHINLYQKFRNGADIFSIISAAIYRG